jgi:hypothetical protein
MITIMMVCELMRNGRPAGVSALAKNKTVDAMSLADLVGAENGRRWEHERQQQQVQLERRACRRRT